MRGRRQKDAAAAAEHNLAAPQQFGATHRKAVSPRLHEGRELGAVVKEHVGEVVQLLDVWSDAREPVSVLLPKGSHVGQGV